MMSYSVARFASHKNITAVAKSVAFTRARLAKDAHNNIMDDYG